MTSTRIIQDLSLAKKLMLLLAVPLITLALFSYRQFALRNDRVSQMDLAYRAAVLSVRINSFVHESQRERGSSGLFLQSKGTRFGSELAEYRRSADEKRAALSRYVREEVLPSQPRWAALVNEALSPFDQVSSLRQEIDVQKVPSTQAFAFYTKAIGGILKAQSSFDSQISQPEVLQQMAGLEAIAMAKEIAGQERALLSIVFASDHFDDSLLERYIGLGAMQDSWFDVYRWLATPGQREFLDKQIRAGDALKVQEFRKLAMSKRPSIGFGVDPAVWFEASSRRIDLIHEAEVHSSDELIATAQTISAEAHRALAFFLAIAAAGAGMVVLLTFVVSRDMTGPLRKSVELAQRVANGDLREDLPTARRDEAGQLFSALVAMNVRLSGIIAEVGAGASSVYAASSQVSATSQKLSRGTTELAVSVEETSASLEQITASVAKNSENSRLLEKMAGESAISTEECRASAQKTMAAMAEIVERISIVEEIAYQTNLLALNAEVEAVRVGELGRGFGVVAAEVRKLAERSGIAAKEINAVASKSADVARRSDRLLEQLVPVIQSTASLVKDVAFASTHQAAGLQQISQAMVQVEQVTHGNASMADELASTAEELASQAAALRQHLSIFQLRESSQSASEREAADLSGAALQANKRAIDLAGVRIE